MWWKRHKCCVYTTDVVDRRALLGTFRERLVQVIDRSGMTRGQFATQNALDRSTLSQLLSDTNRRLPRVETLAEVATTQHSPSPNAR